MVRMISDANKSVISSDIDSDSRFIALSPSCLGLQILTEVQYPMGRVEPLDF